MSSQQELINAINAISGKKNTSFDTPATVLRVEGDIVWVHIDGGADETPVQKTINCEQGETVQVRISNGSAFLVGNASAPPTDDKTAKVAHFVAKQANEKATEAIRSVKAIEQTVEGKVDSGDSNITNISSTMYQNANGVNIYNDTLAVGDSYAHIDGDSFDIKACTTAGEIDDTNDETLAQFSSNGIFLGNQNEDGYVTELTNSGYKIRTNNPGTILTEAGWIISSGKIEGFKELYAYGQSVELNRLSGRLRLLNGSPMSSYDLAEISPGTATFATHESGSFSPTNKTEINGDTITCSNLTGFLPKTEISPGIIKLTGKVQDFDDNNLTPTILESSTISASTTSYTFTNDAITADSVIDIYDTIFGFAPTNIQTSAGSCTITFPAQSSSHTIKLFVY